MGKVDYRITAKWAQLGVGKPGEHEAPDQSRKGRMTSDRDLSRDRTSHARPIRNSPAQREFCDTSAIKDDPAVVMRCSSATFLKRRLRKKKSRRWFTAKTKALLFITTRVAAQSPTAIGMRVIVAAQGTRTAVHSVSSGVCTAY
ncbi:uncharacterized protein CIMG_02604 [Coccidioides immitis RS]|uniref:Uncharacterized protein n=1 Tax=Coccidioides immitis (strain RS) TaxID=246410 RepID=J3KLP9_COCIM|nr:uncharacterized protein CIMG_02604 [Coccidioides immitis RS]EAS37250.3 hypothetical protein CIMG_02604 [Coccidioides immitis RS]